MNRDVLQRILVALDKCCETTNQMYQSIDLSIETWNQNYMDCCETLNGQLDDVIEVIEDWASEYSATYTNHLCQKQDEAVVEWEIVFSEHQCKQEFIAPPATTTTTSVPADQVDFIIEFIDYKCQLDPSQTYTTIEGLKSGTIELSATYTSFLCEKEDDGAATTTTTADPAATTTTTHDPEDVEFSATYGNFLCAKVDNPLFTSTTTHTPIDEDDVEWAAVYKDFLCAEEFEADTTTTTAAATTTTTGVTDTTTAAPTGENCDMEVTGAYGVHTYKVNVGALTGQINFYPIPVNSPDKFEVYFDGVKVIDTGYIGDTSFQAQLYTAQSAMGLPLETITPETTYKFYKGTSTTFVIVKVYAPLEESDWAFTVGCVSSVLDPDLVDYSASYYAYLCAKIDNGVATTTTTTAAVTTTTTSNLHAITCGPGEVTGGKTYPGIYYADIEVGNSIGTVELAIDSVGIPDRFVVEFNNEIVIDTGYRGNVEYQTLLDEALASYGEPLQTIQGPSTGTFSFYKNYGITTATVYVYAPIDETEWSFTLSCPDGTNTTTPDPSITTTTTAAPGTTTTTTFDCTLSNLNYTIDSIT